MIVFSQKNPTKPNKHDNGTTSPQSQILRPTQFEKLPTIKFQRDKTHAKWKTMRKQYNNTSRNTRIEN